MVNAIARVTRRPPHPNGAPPSPATGHIGVIVAGSLLTGLVVAVLLVLTVFGGAREHVITGAALVAFGLGWAMLAVLSTRWTDQPQRWAFLPAAYMGVVGAALLLLAPSSRTLSRLGWIWPPVLLALVVWMVLQTRRHLRSRTRPWLLYPIFVVLLLAAFGGGLETVRESVANTRSAPGRMFDVGGHRLYLNCTGSGSPTVVLAAGAQEHASSWEWVVRTVAADTRVCSYDRAGEGFSESAAGPQDGVQLATDLHTLLARAQVPGPYVLAGHSVGGVYDLIFAARYPAQVAGIALVDSATPEQFTAIPVYPGFYSTFRRVSALFPSLARMGVARVASGAFFGGLPSQARSQERAFGSTARDLRGQRDEWAELPIAFDQAKALTTLGGKPLFVLTAGQGQDTGWFAAQGKLAALSSNSIQRTVRGATHVALLDDKGYSSGSSRAIRAVVRAVRTGTPLKP